MSLYSVTLRRKVLTTIYDDRGRLPQIIREERHITETYSGLPLATANMYREKFPDAVVSIVQDPDTYVRPHTPIKARVRYDGDPISSTASYRARKSTPRPAPAPVARKHGDYADMLNRMAEKEKAK